MNNTQAHAADLLRAALLTLGVDAKIFPTGEGSQEPYDGGSVEFPAANRIVHCYKDEDGTWMIDAMQADIGAPAPQPYRPGRLIAYLEWAQGESDEAFSLLAEAQSP